MARQVEDRLSFRLPLNRRLPYQSRSGKTAWKRGYAPALSRPLTRPCHAVTFPALSGTGRPIQLAKSTVDSAQISAIVIRSPQ